MPTMAMEAMAVMEAMVLVPTDTARGPLTPMPTTATEAMASAMVDTDMARGPLTPMPTTAMEDMALAMEDTDTARGPLMLMPTTAVTRSMSNDPNPDSPRAVMRTYSSYGRAKPGAAVEEAEISTHKGKYPTVRTMSRENLRVQAFSNILSKEGVCQPSEKVHRGPLHQGHQVHQDQRRDHQVTIEMTACPRTR